MLTGRLWCWLAHRHRLKLMARGPTWETWRCHHCGRRWSYRRGRR
jgi:transposase-like protein